MPIHHRTRRVSVHIDAADADLIEQLAAEAQCSQAAVVRQLVRAGLATISSDPAPVR
jgi:Ribbon-helix-helix protein, copG family